MPVACSALEAAIPQNTYPSGGRQIAFECFWPVSEKRPCPAILLLHGADGLNYRQTEYNKLALSLAEKGLAVYVVRYFDRTASRFADPAAILANFMTWQQTIAEGITFVASQPGVDGDRIGLMGVSLGASLAISVAGQDRRVKAVVEVAGALPDVLAALIHQLPPVLILHGESDAVVPVSDAHKLERLLTAKHVPFEMKIYEGQGHNLTETASQDAGERAVKFLDAHLKPAS